MSNLQHIETMYHIARLTNEIATLRRLAFDKDADSKSQSDRTFDVWHRLDSMAYPLIHQALNELGNTSEIQAIRRAQSEEWEEYYREVQEFSDSEDNEGAGFTLGKSKLDDDAVYT